MKKPTHPYLVPVFMAVLLTLTASAPSLAQSGNPTDGTDTWAGWERKMERSFEAFNPRKLPGQAKGIIVPSDPRADILALTAFGYEVLAPYKSQTIVFLMPTPHTYPLNGIVMPESDLLTTSFGLFTIDKELRAAFQNPELPIFVDQTPFDPALPDILLTQLAAIKYYLKGKDASIKFLPIMANFNDLNSGAKDLGPYLAEVIKDLELESQVSFVIMANLNSATSEKTLIAEDNTLMNAVRNLDVDTLINAREGSAAANAGFSVPDMDPLALGVLALRFLGTDHAEALAYTHSGQLVLTKDKSHPIGYLVAGFASEPPLPAKVPHVDRESLLNIFDELFRSDMLTVARQSCSSILDPTAAKPPSLLQPQAAKKWPIFISLYDPNGNLAGQSGSHIPVAPLEESIRRFAFEAVQQAKPNLTKENFQNYLVDVSIPYGFRGVDIPEDLIPMLNGIVVHANFKSYGFHPDSWRTYPHPHQLLGALCFKLGLKPWDYATKRAKIESFRILSFNEKEPFQDLGADSRKKKKKKKSATDEENPEGGADGDAVFPF